MFPLSSSPFSSTSFPFSSPVSSPFPFSFFTLLLALLYFLISPFSSPLFPSLLLSSFLFISPFSPFSSFLSSISLLRFFCSSHLGWQVEKVFGSPGNSHPTASEAEGAKGKETTLCKISSVFPSPKASPTQTKVEKEKFSSSSASLPLSLSLFGFSSYPISFVGWRGYRETEAHLS